MYVVLLLFSSFQLTADLLEINLECSYALKHYRNKQ